ncbi:MAG: hypothetical protein L0H84_19570, partial [Pseudonocardia sp.]|nr:hypothetical protein [Pseudonocardia sp.]
PAPEHHQVPLPSVDAPAPPPATPGPPGRGGAPLWLLVSAVVVVVAAVLGVLATLGGASLPDRNGPPIEELTVERAIFTPGTISLVVRNSGADPVTVAQVFINDTYVDFTGPTGPIARLDTARLDLDYPWGEGQPYTISMLTSTGLVIEHAVPAAIATPQAGAGLFGLMALLGIYVGVLPVLLGMLVLPILRRTSRTVVRVLLAVTVGLLAFLAVDAFIEGFEIAAAGGAAFGGPLLVVLGAGLAFLALTAADRLPAGQRQRGGLRLAFMIAIGIGLHNLGEGLAIGSAYAVGELALGTALVVGFALHNTTEGLAIVAPLTGQRVAIGVLAVLGLLAGAPAILGTVIGVSVDNPALTAVLLGLGVGAIVSVIVSIAPALRDPGSGRALDPPVAAGLAAGVLVMFLTGLLVAV